MQNCGSCKHFKAHPAYVGWEDTPPQGVCKAPIPEGYAACKRKLMNIERGTECLTWEQENGRKEN